MQVTGTRSRIRRLKVPKQNPSRALIHQSQIAPSAYVLAQGDLHSLPHLSSLYLSLRKRHHPVFQNHSFPLWRSHAAERSGPKKGLKRLFSNKA